MKKAVIRTCDIILRGAEQLGWTIDQLLAETLEAMKSFA